MFNFNTVSDIIPSHFFISTKNHVIFGMNNSSSKLSETIMYYIIFLTLCSFNFLLRLDYNTFYNYTRTELNSDLIFVSLFIAWLNFSLFTYISIFYILTLLIFPNKGGAKPSLE